MFQTVSRFGILYRSYLILLPGVLCVLCFPSLTEAQRPTATITALSGEALVFIQGGSPVPGSVDAVLHAGDTIRTHAGTTVVLELSDGSALILGENTNLDISELAEDPQTGARTSRLKLLWGKMRSLVSSGHQVPGSSFNIETPNALAGVKFSEPDSEVLYDPTMSTTTVIPHKFDVVVTNRVTNDSVRIPEGYIGIIHERGIQKIARTIPFLINDVRVNEIAKLRLDSIANILKEFPDQTIILEGHADNVGTEEKNKELGLERAEVVQQYLVAQYGFDPKRIKVVSYGDTRPIAPNDTEAGRTRNRRVTISREL